MPQLIVTSFFAAKKCRRASRFMAAWLALAVWLVAATSAVEPVTQLPPEDVAFTAKLDGVEQRYVVILPTSFDRSQRHTALIALHGHGSDRWQFVKQTRGECQAARDAAAKHGLVFVSPDYRATTSWMGPAAEADMLQIIDELRERYAVDRFIVSGGSMGGTAALAFAALHPDRIAGVVSLNGTANLVEYANFADAIAKSYGGTKQERPEVYQSRSAELHADKLTMPIAITTGGRDQAVPPESCVRLVQKLQQLQRPVHHIHRPDGGHATDYRDSLEAFTWVIDHVKK